MKRPVGPGVETHRLRTSALDCFWSRLSSASWLLRAWASLGLRALSDPWFLGQGKVSQLSYPFNLPSKESHHYPLQSPCPYLGALWPKALYGPLFSGSCLFPLCFCHFYLPKLRELLFSYFVPQNAWIPLLFCRCFCLFPVSFSRFLLCC